MYMLTGTPKSPQVFYLYNMREILDHTEENYHKLPRHYNWVMGILSLGLLVATGIGHSAYQQWFDSILDLNFPPLSRIIAMSTFTLFLIVLPLGIFLLTLKVKIAWFPMLLSTSYVATHFLLAIISKAPDDSLDIVAFVSAMILALFAINFYLSQKKIRSFFGTTIRQSVVLQVVGVVGGTIAYFLRTA